MEAEDAPGETSAAYEPSPDGKRAKSMVAALQLDTQECLDRLDDLDARLGVDRRKVHEEYINSVRASVTTFVKRIEATPSVSADAGRGLSDLDARIAAAKAEILARQETEAEAKRRHEEMVRSMKHVENILKDLDALAAAAGDDPIQRDDTAEKLEALDEYKLRDDLQARPTCHLRSLLLSKVLQVQTSVSSRASLHPETLPAPKKKSQKVRRRRALCVGCSARRRGRR